MGLASAAPLQPLSWIIHLNSYKHRSSLAFHTSIEALLPSRVRFCLCNLSLSILFSFAESAQDDSRERPSSFSVSPRKRGGIEVEGSRLILILTAEALARISLSALQGGEDCSSFNWKNPSELLSQYIAHLRSNMSSRVALALPYRIVSTVQLLDVLLGLPVHLD